MSQQAMGLVALLASVIAFGSSGAGTTAVTPPWSAPATPRPAELEKLEKLLDVTAAADPARPDLMLRLANLCAGSADRVVRERAVALLRDLTANKAYANYARRDQALFSLGVALGAAGDTQGSRAAYMELIKNHPRSSMVPMVYAHFGDHFFDAGAMKNARRFYDKVLQFPRSRAYDYALYKSGWVAINLGDFRRALEVFVKVHRQSRDPAIRRGAAEAMVLAYAQVGRPDKAYSFFRRIDPGAAAAMQEKLAGTYATGGQWAEAMTSFRELIAREPKSPRLCRWQAEIARAARLGASRAEAARELSRLRAIGKPECRELAAEISTMP